MGYGVAMQTRPYRHLSAEEREAVSLGLALITYLYQLTL
jgi:hypothetical protein